ncbi:MAG TPA: hypothetical protein VE988_12705 [Gemmataceae bacterium]|nr:hypothetical protein [Gemmataceae bacterium]
MQRLLRMTFVLAALLTFTALISPAKAQPNQQWGTIKGQIVWGGKAMPAAELIDIPKGMVQAVVKNPNFNAVANQLKSDALIVNPQGKGIKNVFVCVLEQPGKKLAIHPKLQAVPKSPVVVKNSNGLFEPRIAVVREGQALEFQNNGIFNLTVMVQGDPGINPPVAHAIPAAAKAQLNLKAQKLPLAMTRAVHAWMQGRIHVVAHPYAVLTDDNGNFEIKDVPAGGQKLFIYHETIGYRLGAKGRNGEDVNIPAGGAKNLGALNMR